MFAEDYSKLESIALLLRESGQWPDFATYCDLRAKGLRKEAMKALELFVNNLQNQGFERRKNFVTRAMESQANFGIETHAVFPHPLSAKILLPSLKEWAVKEDNARVYFWMSKLGDTSLENLKRALEIDPSFDAGRVSLCELLLADISYNQHHLPDFYIHDPREDLKELDDVETLIADVKLQDWVEQIVSDISDYRNHALEWLRLHPDTGDFASH